MHGTIDRQKFIILTEQRTGSCHLEYLLDSHEMAKVGGELFNPSYERSAKEVLVQGFAHLRRDDPIGYLETFFSQPFSEPPTHIGFRLFYSHGRASRQQLVWNSLQNMPDLKVIHLQRKNLLKNFLSLKLAEASSVWMRNKSDPALTYQPIVLDHGECVQHFKAREQNIERFDQFFLKKPRIDVFYEDLVNREKQQLDRVLKFLGLEAQSLTSRTGKQNTQELSELILNYSQLKKSFAHTMWVDFFED